MVKLASALLLTIFLLHPVFHTSYGAESKPRVAVLKLAERGAREEADAIAEELRLAFVNTNRFIVIDRTLTDQILKEWELQQSGMTERDKAVRIGKLFNVQMIVTGKLNKFPGGGWQVSAVMLDAQTGITKKAKIVRHRGDFFSLLDTKVPILAESLAGKEDIFLNKSEPTPKTQKAKATVSRPVQSRPESSGGVKIGIFPGTATGERTGEVTQHFKKLNEKIAEAVKKQFPKISVSFAYIRNEDQETKEELKNRIWDVGIFSINPNEGFISLKLENLNLDAALLYHFYVYNYFQRLNTDFKIFIIHQKQFKSYEESGEGNVIDGMENWEESFMRTVTRLLKKFHRNLP